MTKNYNDLSIHAHSQTWLPNTGREITLHHDLTPCHLLKVASFTV